MRVLVIFDGYIPLTDTGDKIRALNMLSSLRNRGYDTMLLGFYSYKYFRRVKKDRADFRISQPGTRFHLFMLPPFGNNPALHLLPEIYLNLLVWLVCIFYRPDLIQAEKSDSAQCTKFIRKTPLITDFHADTIPELEMTGASSFQIWHAVKGNKYALRRSRYIITVSENLYRNLGQYATRPEHITIPCNVNMDSGHGRNEAPRVLLRKKHNLGDRIVLCYLGGLMEWQCIRQTFNFVIRLHELDKSVFFCLFTQDDVKPFQTYIDRLGQDILIQPLKPAEVPGYLSMADAGFVLRENSPVNINSSPTKTAEYLANGVFVIATQYSGDAPVLIGSTGCGIILSDPEPDETRAGELHTALLDFMENRNEISGKAVNFIRENRTWAAIEQNLYTLYDRLS
jgi:glycosyltransferase involved in cell wall biosynthesis